MRRIFGVVACVTLLASTLAAPVNASPSQQLAWKVQVALRCDLCVTLAARAVEIKLYADGTGTYELTDIGAPSASHQVWAFTWTIGDGSLGPNSLIQTGGTIYIPDTHETFAIDAPRDTGVQLVPGHYDSVWRWGDLAGPGMASQIQVVQMP